MECNLPSLIWLKKALNRLGLDTGDSSDKVSRVSSTDNAIVRFDGTTGEVQDSNIIVNDNGSMNITFDDSVGINLSLSNDDITSAQTVTFSGDSQSWNLGGSNSNNAVKSDAFFLVNVTKGSIPFVIDSNDNVGIGTTSPDTKLAVNGDITTRDENGSYKTTQKIVGGTSVSTTETSIMTTGNGGLCTVFGEDGTNQFYDLVFFTSYGSTPTVVSSKIISGSPVARTYTSANGGLSLAMASGTYTVVARGSNLF